MTLDALVIISACTRAAMALLQRGSTSRPRPLARSVARSFWLRTCTPAFVVSPATCPRSFAKRAVGPGKRRTWFGLLEGRRVLSLCRLRAASSLSLCSVSPSSPCRLLRLLCSACKQSWALTVLLQEPFCMQRSQHARPISTRAAYRGRGERKVWFLFTFAEHTHAHKSRLKWREYSSLHRYVRTMCRAREQDRSHCCILRRSFAGRFYDAIVNWERIFFHVHTNVVPKYRQILIATLDGNCILPAIGVQQP